MKENKVTKLISEMSRYQKIPNNDNAIMIDGKIVLSFDPRYKEYLKWKVENPLLDERLGRSNNRLSGISVYDPKQTIDRLDTPMALTRCRWKKVLVTVVNNDWAYYARQMFMSAIIEGKWDGDFVLVLTEESELESFYIFDRIVQVYRPPKLTKNPPPHFYKMYLFDEFFSKWDWILFSDTDVLFLGEIDKKLFDRDKKLLYANTDGLSFMQHFGGEYDAFEYEKRKREKSLTDEQKLAKNEVYEKYGDGKAFQTCFMLFNKHFITQNYFDKLIECYTRYYIELELAKNSWWDQTIFNLIFFDKWNELGEKFINRNPALDRWYDDTGIPSKISKWKEANKPYYDDTDYSNTTALHFFHFLAPWSKMNERFYPNIVKYSQNSNIVIDVENIKNKSFINIGTNDGIYADPIYQYLQVCDLSGVCVEPIDFVMDIAKENYKNFKNIEFENSAIMSESGKQKMYYLYDKSLKEQPLQYSRCTSFDILFVNEMKKMALDGSWKEKYDIDVNDESLIIKEIEVNCITFDDLLSKYNIDDVGFLNIDAESYDYYILKSIDFNKVRPQVVCYERINMTHEEYREIQTMLFNLNYERGYHPEWYNIIDEDWLSEIWVYKNV